MKNSLETRLGIFFALAVIVAILILEMAGGFDFFKKDYTVQTSFKNVQELKEGDPVKMAGVEIGRVGKIGLTNSMVLVDLKLKEGAVIRTDSKASIEFTGLLGQNFVALTFGTETAPAATPGAMIESAESANLSSLMVKLEGVASGVENLTKSFTGEGMGDLLGPLTDFVKQNSTNLSATIQNVRTISDNLAAGNGTVGKLLKDEALYDNALTTVSNIQNTLQSTADDIRSVVTAAKTTVDGINQGQGTIGKLAKDDALYTEATLAMKNAREILEKVNQGKGTVGKIVNDETLFKNAKLTLQKVEKATESLEDQGPLSILGLAIGSLF